MAEKKLYYVPWQGYQDGQSDRQSAHDLDTLCLQGPHTLEKAHELATEMRGQGLRASVIDASSTLNRVSASEDTLNALELAWAVLAMNHRDSGAFRAVDSAIKKTKGNE